MCSFSCERRNGIGFPWLALLPSRPTAASRDVPRLPHISAREVVERNASSLPAECQRFGPRAWPNVEQIVSGFSDRSAESTRFQNARKQLCAGLTTLRAHLLYRHTGSLKSAWHG